MDAKVYIDIRIRSGSPRGQRSNDGMRPEHIVARRASGAVKVLHGAFSRLAGDHKFALDLPRAEGEGNPISLIRVFAESAEAMLTLIDAVSEPLTGLGVFASDQQPRIHRVPEDFSGPWAVCRRYRVPSRHSFSRSKSGLNHRVHAMRQASERRLPFFFVDSTSNGQHFVMHVERQVRAHRPVRSEACTESVRPSAYGLSTKQSEIALPSIGA